MIRHPSLLNWESRLKDLLDSVDDDLEEKYGSTWNLHPARSARGDTSNKAHDGLFDITAGFSLGLGSEKGRGYVVDIHMSTLENVTENLKQEIEAYALKLLQKRIKNVFPENDLNVEKDGDLIKIFGNLSLD